MGRSIYCSNCKKEKESTYINDSRCGACKAHFAKLLRKKRRIESGKLPDRPEREPKCNECISKKENGISITGRCNKCVTISNNERRHQKRKQDGLPEIPIRDSSFCHICKIQKIDGRCIPCRQRMAKERKEKKRSEKGLRPWGAGRPSTCYKCGNEKENIKNSHCNECASSYNKERWRVVIAPRVNRKKGPLPCVCGKEKESYSNYCKECAAIRMREWRLNQSKGLIKPKKVALTPEQKKLRRDVRAITHSALRRGLLKRAPCEICGTDLNIEAHHDDYTKPLDIRWLCKSHHDEHHKNND